MKLIVYAREVGVSYRTAFRWLKSGKIEGRHMDTGTILIPELIGGSRGSEHSAKVTISTHVSAAENKDDLEGQADCLRDYCAAKGYSMAWVVKEIGSGLNDTRPRLLKLLTYPSVRLIVVEHKDRLTRFGSGTDHSCRCQRLLQYPAKSIPIGFRLWDNGRCSSPGTGSTCTKAGQLALSINTH